MRLARPTPYADEPIDYPAPPPLEEFCEDTCRTYATSFHTQLSAVALAYGFRQYFHVPVPVRSVYLFRLFDRIGIAIRGIPPQEDYRVSPLEALWHYNEVRARYEILLPYDSKDESKSLLHEILEIIFGRCFFLAPWWKDWMAENKIVQGHQLADAFADAVLMPPHEFKEKALEFGYDVFALAQHFAVRPAQCAIAVQMLALPCPLFLARLNTRNINSVQEQILFDEHSVRAEVWSKFRKSAPGLPRKEWEVIDMLGDLFPGRNHIVIADGIMYRALKEGRSLTEITDTIAGIRLSQPVCLAARPHRNQLLLQAVPVEYQGILLDDAFQAQMEETA